MSTSHNILVISRFRPLNAREKALKENQDDCIQYPSDTQVIVNGVPFTFDRVFSPESTQEQVFDQVSDTILDVLKGYNGSILTYGQTGSGKSFSIFGVSGDNDLMGIIPRSNQLIFDSISDDTHGNTEFTIKCSFLEIYMEVIQDLLNPKNKNLKIRESKTQGIYVEGLTEEFVGSEQDIMDLISIGESSRSTAKTNMNEKSSRSHSMLVISIEQKSSDGSKKKGKLNLVDLAGSERQGKTQATGQTLDEAKKINQSLSSLGNCIHALTESKRDHIPFRDSKLTRLLQDSLGGNTKTTLLVTASPHFSNIEETISTLKFGARAKSIKNNVKVNQEKSAAELQIIVHALTKELSTLKVYSISLENLVNYFKSSSYQPGQPIPKELEPNKSNLLLLQQSQSSSSSSSSSSTTPPTSTLKPRSATPTSNRPPSSQSSHRHSIAITGSHSNNNNNNTPSNGGGMTSSISSSSISSLTSSIESDYNSMLDDSNGLFNPLAIVEMSIEIERMKEDTQLLIEKFKDDISEITIQYESSQAELIDVKKQLDESKELAEQSLCNFKKEQSSLKETERNLTLESTSRELKIQSLISKIEDLRLLTSQVIQYLERRKLSDDFDMGILMNDGAGGNGSNGSGGGLGNGLNSNYIDEGTYEDDINIEDIIRYLSEEEVLSMQVKLQLQNKVSQLEHKVNQLISELNSTEHSLNQSILSCQKLESENSIIRRKFKSMFSSFDQLQQQQQTPPSSPSSSKLQLSNGVDTENNTSTSNVDNEVDDNQIEHDDDDQKQLEESSKRKENEIKMQLEIKNLKLINEKNTDELNKVKDELSIKSALYQNQILNLQNENQTISNKLNQEKQQKQSSQSQQIEFATKLNDLIKTTDNEKEEFRVEKNKLHEEITLLKNTQQEMELKNIDLQEQVASTLRLLNSRRCVKIVRGGADSMKRAMETREEFGQHKLKRTGKTLF